MLKIGLQLYSVRDFCEKDFPGTIKKVSDIGYQGLEFAGYHGMKAKELKKVIDGLGIRAVNSHVPLDSLKNNLEGEIEFAKTLGMDTISVPWLPPEMRKNDNDFLEVMELIHDINEKCKLYNIQLCYHNHDFEFAKIDNEYILDMYMRRVSGLKMELDTFWSSYSNVDTIEYMKKNAALLKYIHLKDMIKDTKPNFAEVGEGCLDIKAFAETGEKLGVEWAFVEQDVCSRPSIESVEISFNNLRKMNIAQ